MQNIDYKNSVALDSGIDIISDDYVEAINHINKEIKKTGKFKRYHPRHQRSLRLIISNVFNTYSIDPNLLVRYSRDKSWYSTSPHNRGVGLRYEAMINVVDTLVECGYLETKSGYWDRARRKGHSARMRATPKLMELLCGVHGVDLLDVRRKSCDDVIILKDEQKKRIWFDDTDAVIRMRNRLETINKMISSKFIGLAVHDETLDEINKQLSGTLDGEGEVRNILDFSRIRLTRIFNNGSFKEGGRFYNGWWQEIPSGYRKYIRIDDIGVEEVDYSGIHINLMYLMEGLPLPEDDVYTIEGIPPESRKMLKIALQIMLNTEKKATATRKIKREFPASSAPELFNTFPHEKIIKAFLKKHHQIEKYFYTGYGVKLQFIDSQIAEDVLLQLAAKEIVALPVHDSFLVQRHRKEDLVEAMSEAVRRKFPQALKVKEDVSAYQEDKSIIAQEIPEEDLPRSANEYEGIWAPAKEFPTYLARMQKWNREHGDHP